MDELTETFGEPIDIRTRADALAAGDLIEVPAEMTRDAGLTRPVAVTRAVWEDCVAWTPADRERTGAIQDEDGRLWDVVWMASRFMLRHPDRSRLAFEVWRVPRDTQPDPDCDIEPVVTYLVVAVDGDGITISRPDED